MRCFRCFDRVTDAARICNATRCGDCGRVFCTWCWWWHLLNADNNQCLVERAIHAEFCGRRGRTVAEMEAWG